MKALRFVELNYAVLDEMPRPVPHGDECLVEVESAGLCHTDLDILAGNYRANFPVTPGHEFSGTVVEVGRDGNPQLLGKRVAANPLIPCEHCRACRRGRHNLCENLRSYGAEIDGGLAEFVTVRSAQLYVVDRLPAELAALAEPLACAINGARRAAARAKDDALVIGAGPIGQLLLIAFCAEGIDNVVMAEPQRARRERAETFGAHTFASLNELSTHRPDGFDLVVDATGRPDVVQDASRKLRPGGRLLLFGVCPPQSSLMLDPHDIYAREITVLGSVSVNHTFQDAIKTLQNSSDLPIKRLITDHLDINKLPDALSVIGSPDSLKVQVSMLRRQLSM